MSLQRSRLLAYFLIFLAALAVRLAIVAAMQDVPIARTPVLDSRQYYVWARWILEGRWTWPQPWAQGPGYPMLLAGLLAAGGGSLTFVASAQAVLGALSAVATAAIAARWFGMKAAIAAGLLQACYAPLAFAETSLLVEGPFILATSGFVLWFSSAPATARGLLLSGALIGLAAIVRTTALPVALVFAAIVPRRRIPMFLAGLMLVTLPVAAVNASQGGGWRLQGKGGLNFWIGNTIEGDGLASFRVGRGWDRAESDADRSGVLDVARHDRHYIGKTLGEIAGAPLSWLALLARKAMWSLQHDEIRDSLSFSFFASEVPWLRWLPGFGVLLAFAVAGAVAAIRARVFPRELALWIAVTWLTLILLVVGYRYRLPLVPPLAILAGYGVTTLNASLMQRRWRTAGVLLIAAIASAAISRAWTHAPSHVFAEELAHTGDVLQTERRFAEAEAMYHRALAADPRSAFAWKGLGMRFYNVNRLDDARAALLQALAIEPMYADAWMRLAWVDGRQRRFPAAAEAMRRAANIYPRDMEMRRYLARYLFEAGAFAEAIPEFERVVAANPRDEEAAGLLEMARRRIR